MPIAILGTLFAPIVAMVLGLSNSYQFDNTISVSPNGPFGSENTNTERFCLGCGVKLKPDANSTEVGFKVRTEIKVWVIGNKNL